MPESELLAIAAHLHVLLRRSCGRVTDTEWLAANAEYAAEIIRFAREQEGARSTPELVEWTHRRQLALHAIPGNALEFIPQQPGVQREQAVRDLEGGSGRVAPRRAFTVVDVDGFGRASGIDHDDAAIDLGIGKKAGPFGPVLQFGSRQRRL